MPGFTTHYLFGLNSFRELEEPDLVSCIRKFPHAFCMGLQGPDIFFYYLLFRKYRAIGTPQKYRCFSYPAFKK